MRVAIAFSTKDRVELSAGSITPLLNCGADVMLFDGSATAQGKTFPHKYKSEVHSIHTDVRGGSGAAIVCALTTLLNEKWYGNPPDKKKNPGWYDYIGLVENDVVLDEGWFEPTMELFKRGEEDGLEVGAVSARCYLDRILIQRDGYAVTHNTGAGMIIFSRKAAELVLREYRVQWTTENRMIFAQLTGKDIGAYWAFRGTEHFLVADWRWDALLASHGMASLALVPSPVTMIGQTPPLEDQGLELAKEPMDALRDDELFKRYAGNLEAVRRGNTTIASYGLFNRDTSGGRTVFPHQIASIGGRYEGDWKLKDAPGFGPFGWIAVENSVITVPVLGPCEFMISGGKDGSEAHVVDEASGYDARPVLQQEGPKGQIMTIAIPGNCNYRSIRATLSPGATFYGVRCRDEQPMVTGPSFSYETLPPA